MMDGRKEGMRDRGRLKGGREKEKEEKGEEGGERKEGGMGVPNGSVPLGWGVDPENRASR